METAPLVKISDYHKLAALDALRVRPIRAERNGRYYELFDAQQAGPILSEFDSGDLSLPVRDFVAALGRVKTRIFESERTNGAGARYDSSPR